MQRHSGAGPAPPAVADRTREQIEAVLADDRCAGRTLETSLRHLRVLDGGAVFAAALARLCHLCLDEPAAERLLLGILEHREAMAARLGRDPGLRVAAVDYLTNVEPRLLSPVFLERAELDSLERRATTDPLTGLANRKVFLHALEQEVRRCRRYGLTLSLVLLDIDRFKRVNDDYGHLEGDWVLRQVAERIRREVRDTDLPARLGGEEFAVLLPETAPLGAYAVADRIRRAVETAFSQPQQRAAGAGLTLSGGVSVYPGSGPDVRSLLASADRTLYRAKALGRNRIALHPEEKRSSVRFPARPGDQVWLLGPADRSPEPATPLNVSRHGMLVESGLGWNVGQPLRVQFGVESPLGESAGTVAATVVRVEPPAGPGQACRAGIAFLRPLPERWLRAHIRRDGGRAERGRDAA